jgi:hypothetical protein
MIFKDPSRADGEAIVTFGNYRPWSWHKSMGGGWSDYPQFSGRMLDLNKGKDGGQQFFAALIEPTLGSGFSIAVVPSHNPEKVMPGIRLFAKALAGVGKRGDATGCLVRHTKIDKLAAGGDRSLTVHLRSIRVDDANLVKGADILLLDDVMTSGNSLIACRHLLRQAGARSVQCVALGRTG